MRRELPIADIPNGRYGLWRKHPDDSELLPEVALRLSRVLRSGAPLETAVVRVDADMSQKHSAVASAARYISSGRPVTEVIAGWTRRAGSDAERLLVSAIEVGVETGADLAEALDSVGEAIRDDVDHDRRRRILLAQSQMSAGVLVCLPLLFAVVSSLTRGVPYSGGVGISLFVSGVVFDALGMLWIRRLLRRLS